MTKKIVMALALSALVTGAGAANAGPAGGPGFNGTWNVQIVTESGPCDASYSYAVAIEDGRIRQAGGDGQTVITGQIRPDGAVGLGVHKGSASANASGRLQSQRGSGTWKLPMLGCSGRWTAQRRTLQANAE